MKAVTLIESHMVGFYMCSFSSFSTIILFYFHFRTAFVYMFSNSHCLPLRVQIQVVKPKFISEISWIVNQSSFSFCLLLLYYQFCKFYILVVSYSLLFTRHLQEGSLIHTHPPPYLSFNCDFSSFFPLMCKDSGERGGSSGAGIFIGGFILGGMVAGTLGCVYAPQVLLND